MNTPLITTSTALSQRGMATLTTALILLVAITLMTFSSARVGVVEQQIAANDYRAKQALHAAQAGLDRAVYESNVLGVGAPTIAGADLAYTAVTALAAVGSGPATSYRYAYSLPPGVAAGGSLALITVTARGFSDDGAASKTLTQYIKLYSPLRKVPDPPVGTGNAYDSESNSIRIENGISSIAIQAQDEIDDHNKDITYVGNPLVAGAGKSEGGVILIPGVVGIVDTTAEREAYFTHAFGTTKADIQSISASVVNCGGNCNSLIGNTGSTQSGKTITYGTPQSPFIWVTGDTTLNSKTVIGSPPKPVVLVVDGTLNLSGDVIIYGFIYATRVVARGSTTVFGSLLSEDSLDFGGNVSIFYNRHGNRLSGPPPGPDFYVKAPGTWNDF